MIRRKYLIGSFNFQEKIKAVDKPDAAKNLVDRLQLLAVKRPINVIMEAVILDKTNTVQRHQGLQLT